MSVATLPIVLQTAYADLIDQLRLAAVSAYPAGSTFRQRRISGRAYWYVQPPTIANGRPAERYLGPATPQLQATIEAAQRSHSDEKARVQIVRALTAGGLPKPDAATGSVLAALARAGAFRLRAVLVGSAAFAAYGGLLGVRLPAATVRTGDLDIAQDYGVSVAIGDELDKPMLEVLREADPSFEPRSYVFDPTLAASFVGRGGFRVDVLTTSRGRVRDEPSRLPALRTEATPLRFLDYALRETVDAAILHKGGVLVRVPSPARFAVHKLLVSVRRTKDKAKARKDLAQAQTLIEVLSEGDPEALRSAYTEARARGKVWRADLDLAVARLSKDAGAFLTQKRGKP
jgi:hypothetical protein